MDAAPARHRDSRSRIARNQPLCTMDRIERVRPVSFVQSAVAFTKVLVTKRQGWTGSVLATAS
jgi:hypothetical protein